MANLLPDESRWRHRRRHGPPVRAIAASAALIAFAGAAIFGAMTIASSSNAGADSSGAGGKMHMTVPTVIIPSSQLPSFAARPSATEMARHPAAASRSPAASASTQPSLSPSATWPGTASSPSATPTAHTSQTVVVNYVVTEQWSDGFQGEVEVVNNTSQALSNWEIVVGLHLDEVASVQNANAYVNDNILIMQPLSADDSVAPGAILRVYFTVEGTETTPSGCAFDQINCS